MTLGIGKQRELPRRPGDWRTAKGDMNAVPEHAVDEATEMAHRHGKPEPVSSGAKVPAKTDESAPGVGKG